MLFITGIIAFDDQGYIGIKILVTLAITAFIVIFYFKKWDNGFVINTIFLCSAVIISSVGFIIILYLSPTIDYVTQAETTLTESWIYTLMTLNCVVLLLHTALLYKIIQLKKRRQKSQQIIATKLADYAILDFLGEQILFKNYRLNKTDVIEGNYWHDVIILPEGEYTLSCDFLYTYSEASLGTGRKGLNSLFIDKINISMKFVTGKQYRIRLAEGEYIMDDEHLYQINMTIPVTRRVNKQPKVLSILVEEKL